MEGKQQVLANREISSLAIDSICDWARGRNVALAYFTFRRQREVFMGEYTGALLKQPIDGPDGEPGKIAQTNSGPEGHWQTRASTFRYCKNTADYLFRKACIPMYRHSASR